MTAVVLSELLKQVKDYLRGVIPSPKYELIIEPLQIESVGEGKVVVLASGARQAQWLQGECFELLQKAFAEILGSPQEIEVRVAPEVKLAASYDSPPNATSVPLSEIRAVKKPKPLLNPRFTFANFVVGPSNEFSYSAAKAVAENPGLAYNPLFIYSDVGLGKTHLLHAIGHHVSALYPNLNLLYVTSERFTSDFIEKVRSGKMHEFHQKYRQLDVLLIDDIQFIAGKVETQTEFFYTFMSLVDAGRQIVVTSDAPPYELKGIEARLISRFTSGLLVDIGAPAVETRIAILQKKAELEGIELDKEVLSFIANNVTTNIRDLEGALIKLLAFCNFSGARCSLEVAERVLADLVRSQVERRFVSVDNILSAVCEVFKVPRDVLLSRDRRKKVADARMLSMYLARMNTNLTLEQIGEELGGRDHSTVSHGIAKTSQLLDEDPYFNQMYQMVIRKLR